MGAVTFGPQDPQDPSAGSDQPQTSKVGIVARRSSARPSATAVVPRTRPAVVAAMDEGIEDGVVLDAPVAPARHRFAYIEMLISSLLSLTASLVLSIEAITLAENPDANLFCDLSSKISCSTVGLAWQSSLLGFPNAFLGLIAEPVVITIAVAALGGVRFPRWFMLWAQAIYTIGLLFAYWLFVQAYFVIGAMCPWCLLVTATTTLVFSSMTRVNILDGNLRVPRAVVNGVRMGLDHVGVAITLAVMAAMVILRYL
jgi:uncharacterized membrane protein